MSLVSKSRAPLQIVARHASHFIGMGIAFTALGTVAILDLASAAHVSLRTIMILLVAGGALMWTNCVRARSAAWIVFWILSGTLYVAGALALQQDPGLIAPLLALVLATALGIAGLLSVLIALGDRGYGWGWVLFSGVTSIVVAELVAIGWPADSLLMLGVVLAIDFLFQGMMLTLTGFMFRTMRPDG